MATKKKSAPTTASGRVNKSAWIRGQPTDLPAKEVLKKAKAEGIKLSLAQVYTARSTAKKAPSASGGGRASAAPKRAPATLPTRSAASGDLRRQFMGLALRLGTDEAQRLLDRVAKVDAGS